MHITFRGKYSYDLPYNEASAFAFVLHLEMENGHFEGHAVEEQFTTIADATAAVTGFQSDDHISFVLTYPFQFEVDEEGNLFIDRDQPGHEVVYEGLYNKETGEWEGEWEISEDGAKYPNGDYDVELFVGSWKMKLE